MFVNNVPFEKGVMYVYASFLFFSPLRSDTCTSFPEVAKRSFAHKVQLAESRERSLFGLLYFAGIARFLQPKQLVG